MTGSLSTKYFDDVYAAHEDPWNFETSEYEREKYANTLRSMPQPRYRRAFEIGCSIGVLTAQLAQRCDRLLSVDVSEAALSKARERCRSLQQVDFQSMSVPSEFPEGTFDLVLVSEVAYYLSPADLTVLADRIAAHQSDGADLVLVHFTPIVDDYPSNGDQVHEYFLTRPEWKKLEGFREERYRLDVLRRGEMR